MTDYEKIISIIEDEYSMEMNAALAVERLIKKTLNPFKRLYLKKHKNMFLDHAIGIRLVMNKIHKEFES